MALLTFIDEHGSTVSFDCRAGGSVMEAAVAHDVLGIEAQCYGAGVCGTCHVYVDQDCAAAAGQASDWERDMLAALSRTRSGSRLSCQIRVSEALAGARFHVPAAQESLA